MTWTWDGKHHTVTGLLTAAVQVLELAEIPDGTVTVECGHLPSGRLHLEIRNRPYPGLTEKECGLLVGTIGCRLAQALNLELLYRCDKYPTGRVLMTRSYVDSALSVAVTGWVLPAPAQAGAR